jgi:glyceraldehyde 3-phosphate dehydrogenase
MFENIINSIIGKAEKVVEGRLENEVPTSNKKIRVAINGFGRIGRAFVRQAMDRDDIELVAINDLGSIDNLAYLLKYDTVYKKAAFEVHVMEKPVEQIQTPPSLPLPRGGAELASQEKKYGKLKIGETVVIFTNEKMPEMLPWKTLNVDVVVESTGLFTKFDDAKKHITAGAKKVVISAPAKDAPTDNTQGTILMGINEEKFQTCVVTSNASCTTNAASPLIAILDESLGIEKAILSTTHGYTASQSLVDAPNKKDWREGRAAAQNIVPSTTGAAIAVTKAFPKLEGLFDGISMRVPVPAGSIVDVTFISKKKTTVEEINKILTEASKNKRWEGIFTVTEEELVSSDIQGVLYASIADLKFTKVVDGNLVKVLAWYDNEMGYTKTLVDHVVKLGSIK